MIVLPKGRLNTSDLRKVVDAKLREVGFLAHMCVWSDRPNCLAVLCGSDRRQMAFPSGMSKRALIYQIGILTGWADDWGKDQPAPAPAKGKPAQIDLVDAIAEASA